MPIRPILLARGLVIAAATSCMFAAPALAETSIQSAAEKAPAVQAENQPQQLQLCRRDNPAIDYRACVNASTRDLARKIRQA